MVEFSESDLLRGKVVPQGWYLLDILNNSEWNPSKAGDSNNLTYECVIVKNYDNGETEGVAGVPITLQFNDKPKARGFIEGFFRALGVDVVAGRYDMSFPTGKQVVAFVEPEEYEGRIRNRVNHKYRQLRAA